MTNQKDPEIVTIDSQHLAEPGASVRDKLAFLLSCSADGNFTYEKFMSGAEITILGDDMIRIALCDVVNEDDDDKPKISEESEWDIVLLRRG